MAKRGETLTFQSSRYGKKEKMVNLDDVCEWVENHIFDFPWYDNECDDFSSKDVANALRKAMEE